MGSGASAGLAAGVTAASTDDLKTGLAGLSADAKAKLIAALGGASKSAGGGSASNAAATKAHDEEEEEDDDDDDLDDVPPPPERTVGARGSVSAEAYGAWNVQKAFTAPVHPKSDQQKTDLKKILETSFMFRALNANDMKTIVDSLEELKVEPKKRVITQGEMGDYLFLIEKGTFDCVITAPDGTEKVVKTCQPGDVFGELALLYNCNRAASVDAGAEACVIWKLDRETFNHIVAQAAQARRNKYVEFLRKVALLETMDEYERSQIADALKPEKFPSGTEIIKQGDAGHTFYIVEEGTGVALKDGKEVMQYAPGSFFGELALLTADNRQATVKATSDVSLLTLDRRTFTRMLGGLEDLLRQRGAAYL